MQQPPNPDQPYPYQPTQPPYNQQQTPVPPLPYQYNNYPPQQPPMMPKKSKTWLWVTIALFIGIFLGYGAGHSGTTTSNTTPATTNNNTTADTSAQPTQAQPTQAPTKPQTWTTTQNFSGNGSKKTGSFNVPSDWKIKWTCNPASFGGADYNVIVAVYNSDGSIADFGAINATCKNGSTSGETEEHQGGNVYLDITSEGDWTFTVQELK